MMKSKVWSLTKVFLKCSFTNMESKKNKNNKNQNSLKWILLYGFLIIYLCMIIGSLSFGVINSLKAIRTRTGIFKLIFSKFRITISNTVYCFMYEYILLF